MEEEEESSCPYVECKVPRELLLCRDQLMPPLEIGFESFKEKILIVQQFWRSWRRNNDGTVQLSYMIRCIEILLTMAGVP